MERMVYFDNAATTFPKPENVYTFMDKFYRECGVNVGRGQYKLATRALKLVVETRELLLSLNHCSSKRVVFTNTATEAINIILQGIRFCDGGNVYVSPFEHNAIMRTLYYIGESKRLNVITLAFDRKNGVYDLEKIKYQFADNSPSFVVISHASNVCGIIAPIVEICALAKSHNAITMLDMCQTMGLIDTDLENSDIDYAAFAGHKTLYAPFGIAGFICTADTELKPLLFGGTGVESASRTLPETIPERFEVGSLNIMAIAGLNASLRWINEIGIVNIYRKEQENREQLIKSLNRYDNIQIVPSNINNKAIGVVSCTFGDYGSDSIGQILSNKNIAVRTGLHCAPTAHSFLGTFPAGTVRFSVGYFNNDDDLVTLEEALMYIQENS